MSRSLSNSALQAVYAQETAEEFLELLTIDHDDLVAPIRVVNHYQDIISNGETYIGLAFRVSLPEDNPESVPEIIIEVDNVDRAIVESIRLITSPPSISFSIVLASSPDIIEFGPLDMKMKSSTYDAFTVTGTCGLDDILSKGFPLVKVLPTNFPGAF